MTRGAKGSAFDRDLMRGETGEGQKTRRKKPTGKAFGTHAATGGGDFNDQVLGAAKKRKPTSRAFGQDLTGAEGSFEPARGITNRGHANKAKGAAGHSASLGADALTHGTSTRPYNASGRAPGAKTERPDPHALPGDQTRAVDPASVRAGVFKGGTPDTARDSQFYAKKRAAERALGRELSVDEFRERYYVPDDAATAMGTSIFDPVLTELLYRWFCPPGGTILDPFAGGSVRGVVAGILGRHYHGIDLRPEQVEANRIQAELIFDGRDRDEQPMPIWYAGDSVDVLAGADPSFNALFGQGVGGQVDDTILGPSVFGADLVFTCPPYADLEVYSDDPRDLSTMSYADFLATYKAIIRAACDLLKPNRFAAIVVGDVRGPDGCYRNFVSDTISAFLEAGLKLYNEAILVTAVGSLPVRAGRQFAASKKLGKTHQNILVFVKGDPRAASSAVGEVQFGDLPDPDPDADPDPAPAAAAGVPQARVLDDSEIGFPIYVAEPGAPVPHDAQRVVTAADAPAAVAALILALHDAGRPLDVLIVGADCGAYLDEHAPGGWEDYVAFMPPTDGPPVDGLDPDREGRCVPYLRPGDLLLVG